MNSPYQPAAARSMIPENKLPSGWYTLKAAAEQRFKFDIQEKWSRSIAIDH